MWLVDPMSQYGYTIVMKSDSTYEVVTCFHCLLSIVCIQSSNVFYDAVVNLIKILLNTIPKLLLLIKSIVTRCWLNAHYFYGNKIQVVTSTFTFGPTFSAPFL
jgi:hypothetical protein